MTAAKANLLNALALIGVSLWAYVANGMSSETTLIPVAFGALLLLSQPFLARGSWIAVWLAAALTFLILAALFQPLLSSIGKGLPIPVLRVFAMQATSALALFVFARALFERSRGDP
ncbi:MAG: hypothetical protein AAF322_21450 [Pseudomonadota bacterium]